MIGVSFLSMKRLFFGTFIHSKSIKQVEILTDYVLQVSENGKIQNLLPKVDFEKLKENFDDFEKVYLKESQFMIPGMIDTHIHAPQYINSGLGTDLPLLDWLKKYTFPKETKFKDLNFAKDVYEKVVKRLIKNGTTTVCYFGTIHLEASILLSDICQKYGQRAFIGKVCMDQNSPDDYIEKTQESIEKTKEFVEKVLEKSDGLIQPIITPRFAPTCSLDLMKGISKIARDYKVPIQTHLSENKAECQWVKELFPNHKSYTDVYDDCGLLTDKTILAHGIWLSKDELNTIKKRGSSISHCPLSNYTIDSGCLNVRRLLKNEIKTSLGTDCSGGYSTSMLCCIRNTINCSHSISFMLRDEKDLDLEIQNILDKKSKLDVPEYSPLSYHEAFYLATMGGAESLGMQDLIGNFKIEKDFDALLIDVDVKDSAFDSFIDEFKGDDKYSSIFQRFLLLGDDRNILNVFIKGKKVL